MAQFSGEMISIDSKCKRLFEDFANWANNLASVLRFTKLYGPLEVSARPGVDFRFRLENWDLWQAGVRGVWGTGTSLLGIYDDRPGGRGWQYQGSVLSYRAASLWEYLQLSLMACPKERLRKCARPDCPHPYFVARHLKQNYCSEPCATWGQRQWKLKWWKEHGKEWREKHQGQSTHKRR